MIPFRNIQQNTNRNKYKGKISVKINEISCLSFSCFLKQQCLSNCGWGISHIYNNFITPWKCLEEAGRGEKWLSAGACYCVINFIHLFIYCCAAPTVVRFNEGSTRLEVLLTGSEGGAPRGTKRSGGKMIGRMKNGWAIIRIEESKGRPQPRLNEKKKKKMEGKEKLIVWVMDRAGREEGVNFEIGMGPQRFQKGLT